METFSFARGGAADGAAAGTPDFLNKLRSSVSDSPEFRALAARLYSGVRDSLRKDNLPSFGTLGSKEQEALVNRVRSQLLEDEVYARCRDATWRALDAALDAEAETVLSKRSGDVAAGGAGSDVPADRRRRG